MTDPAWVFLAEEGESLGARVARCARSALADGPMGQHLRPDFYREFISCGWVPPLVPGTTWDGSGNGIETLHTSCGIFVRAVLHHSGRTSTQPGRVGGALIGGWLERLALDDAAWIDVAENVPEPGDVFYREYAKTTAGRSGHVGIFIEPMNGPGEMWRTAEGGGGDGTLCRIEERRPFEPDSSPENRRLLGWWRPALMTGWVDPDADTEPPPTFPDPKDTESTE